MDSEALQLLQRISGQLDQLLQVNQQSVPRAAIPASEARARLGGISKTAFKHLLRTGRIRRTATRLGRENMVLTEDVEALLRTPERLIQPKAPKPRRPSVRAVPGGPGTGFDLEAEHAKLRAASRGR
jgi:hypothetical protein